MLKDNLNKLFEDFGHEASFSHDPKDWTEEERVWVKITDESLPEFGKIGEVKGTYPDFVTVDIDGEEVNVDQSQFERVEQPVDQTEAPVKTEVAPEGWEGTVKAMKKNPKIKNPWALAWSMKNKGYTSHKGD